MNTVNLLNKELAITGSLGNANTIFKKRFIEKIHQIDPGFKIHENLMDSSIGACILGLKNAGITLCDKSLTRLKNK